MSFEGLGKKSRSPGIKTQMYMTPPPKKKTELLNRVHGWNQQLDAGRRAKTWSGAVNLLASQWITFTLPVL